MTTFSALPRVGSDYGLRGSLPIAWLACVLAAWIVGQRLEFAASFAVKAGVVFGAVTVLILHYVPRHHPFARFGAANIVTTLRAALVAVAAGAIGETVGDDAAAVVAGLGLTVGVLDGVDGWLARRSGLASEFGARFDMEVDALLILILSVLAWQLGKAGAWIMLAGLLRYLFVAAGWAFAWINAPLGPSWRRKAICVVQIAGLAVLIVPAVQPPASVWVGAGLLLALTFSFAVDVLWLWQRVE